MEQKDCNRRFGLGNEGTKGRLFCQCRPIGAFSTYPSCMRLRIIQHYIWQNRGTQKIKKRKDKGIIIFSINIWTQLDPQVKFLFVCVVGGGNLSLIYKLCSKMPIFENYLTKCSYFLSSIFFKIEFCVKFNFFKNEFYVYF